MILKFNKNIYIIFIFAVLYNSSGFILPYLFQKNIHKENIFKEIGSVSNEQRVEKLYLSIDDIKSAIKVDVLDDKEIRIGGKMYDVLRKEKIGGVIIFYCIRDEKEELMDKYFSENVSKNSSGISNGPKFKYQINPLVYLIKNSSLNSALSLYEIFQENDQNCCSLKYSKTPSPPPKNNLFC